MPKPTILLGPGSFALPEFYDPVMEPVATKGYEIRGLHLPSVSVKSETRDGGPPTMYDDAAFIATAIAKIADGGKDVVLIAHSYGGVPATESTKGLGKQERQNQGKKGGVVNIAYMTAIVPAIRTAAMSVLADVPPDQQLNLKIDERGWMAHDDVAKSAAISFSDLPKEEGEAWIRRFAHHSAATFANEMKHAGYRDIPVSWLFCEQDLCITPTIQKKAIEMIEKESGKKVDVTSIDTGHVPSATRLQEVVEWVSDVAGKASIPAVA